jgi:hypothetical protein
MSEQPPCGPRESADSPSPFQPPAGWYLDPEGLQVLRWWDGAQWTFHSQPLPAPRQESPPEPEQDPFQPLQPQGWPDQQPGPQQQSYLPEPRPQVHHARRRPRNRKARDALIGIGVLLGIIVAIGVAASHGSPSPEDPAATSPATSAPAAASALSASCASQMSAWRDHGGVTELDGVGNAIGALGSDGTAVGLALTDGTDTSSQQSNLQAAASSVQADAQTAEANLPPSCIPHLRSDVRAALADADKAGIDSAQTVSEMGSGNYDVAAADIPAADQAENAGSGEVVAALADIKAYEGANG